MKVLKGCFIFLLFTLSDGSLKHAYESLQWGKRLVGRLLTTIAKVSPMDCAEECLVRPGCLSFNYRRAAIFCELNYENDTSSDTRLTNEDGWIFSRRESWPMEITEECQNKTCGLNEKCSIVHHSPSCSAAQCHPLNLSLPENVKKFSSDIALDFGSRHKLSCMEGYNQTGKGIVMCLWDGTWSDANLTCQDLSATSLKPLQECYYHDSRFRADETKKKKRWEDAKDACKAMDGYLLEIDSKEEFEFIKEHYIGDPPTYMSGMTDIATWIGGKYKSAKKIIEWSDSRASINVTSFNALLKPPHVFKGNNIDDCLLLNKEKVKTHDCSKEMQFFCEFKECKSSGAAS